MRILILNDHAATVGGAEWMTVLLRDELRRRGHDARIFASDAVGHGPVDYECFGTVGRARTLNRVANLRAYRRLRRALAGFRPDVAHVRMFMSQLSPLVLPLLARVPTVYHAVWYETICPTGFKLLPDGSVCRSPAGRACRSCLSPPAWSALMLQRALWRRWRAAIDVVVANSDAVARRLEAEGIGPVVRVWNGVPRAPARPPLQGPPTAVYAGRLNPEKGVETLVRAFAAVPPRAPDARLLMVGDGPLRAPLERIADGLGLAGRIEWTGHLPREEAERRAGAGWVQVVPSALEEPFGLAAAEALMRGTAVVASDHGGLVEILAPSGGAVLVPPGDAPALGAALAELLADRGRAEAMGAAGRRWAVDRLSLEACVDRFEELYEDLARAGRAA